MEIIRNRTFAQMDYKNDLVTYSERLLADRYKKFEINLKKKFRKLRK